MDPSQSPPERTPTIFGRPAAVAVLSLLAFGILGANYLTGGFGADGGRDTAEQAQAKRGSKEGDFVSVRVEKGDSVRPFEVDAEPDERAVVRRLEITTRKFAAEQRRKRILERYRPLPGGVTIDRLEQIASCESGGDPEIISSNGLYHGKYQFHPDTWESVGGEGLPSDAPEVEQDYRAALLLERSGPGQWPVCGA